MIIRPEYPKLQELVAMCGGYHAISDQDWARYDRAVAAWRNAYRDALPRVPSKKK